MKKVLMIASHFPPVNNSGTARSFQFAKNLPDFGFYPIVLTERVFPTNVKLDFEPLEELKSRCKIVRIKPLFLDSSSRVLNRLLALIDIPFLLAHKDKWRISKGLKYIWKKAWRRRERQLLTIFYGLKTLRTVGFDIIWVTGPPWRALHAGYLLSLLTRKPMVADIRDPWTYGLLWHPRSRQQAARVKMWEQRVLKKASLIVYTSPLTTKIMKSRSDKRVAERMVTITNGFSEAFSGVKRTVPKDKCLFCYVGNLMRINRDPSILLEGLSLACRDPIMAEGIRLQFIGHMDGFEEKISKYGLEKQIECLGPVSYKDSRRFMRGSDVLILFQTIFGDGTDVIGGKAYEYLAAHNPILGVVPEDGGDAWLLHQTKAGFVTGIDDPSQIAQAFCYYWQLWRNKKLAAVHTECDISQFCWRNLTKKLAELFDEVLSADSTAKCWKKSVIF